MMNGMNGAGPAMQGAGAMNPGAAMAAVGPTPAGHQAELNVIYGLVEELSRQLAENRRQTEDIVSGIGRVRHRARERGMGNDMILEEAADEIYGMFFFPLFRVRIVRFRRLNHFNRRTRRQHRDPPLNPQRVPRAG